MTYRSLAVVLLAIATPVTAGPFDENMRQCISVSSIKAESAETESRLIFHSGSGRAFISHLPAPCDGLLGVNNLAKLRLNAQKGEKLCAGHEVTIEPKLGSDTTPIKCRLGAFEAVSEMSISEMLRR